MRLSNRLIVVLGVLLLLFSNIQPASASHRFSESLPVSQSPDADVKIEYQTLENGIAMPVTRTSPFGWVWLFVAVGFCLFTVVIARFLQ